MSVSWKNIPIMKIESCHNGWDLLTNSGGPWVILFNIEDSINEQQMQDMLCIHASILGILNFRITN